MSFHFPFFTPHLTRLSYRRYYVFAVVYRLSPIVPSFHFLHGTALIACDYYKCRRAVCGNIVVACISSDLSLHYRHATNINFFHLSVSLSKLWNLLHCKFLSFCPFEVYGKLLLQFLLPRLKVSTMEDWSEMSWIKQPQKTVSVLKSLSHEYHLKV
mgnify:CR=1 FL=1